MRRQERRRRGTGRTVRSTAQVTVLALLVGGTAAFAGQTPTGPVVGTALAADVTAGLDLRERLTPAASRGGAERAPVATTRTVAVTIDGGTTELLTTGSTVRDVLLEAGVVLGPHDRVSLALDAVVEDGLEVVVTRVVTEMRSETTTLPFETLREDDPELLEGREVVATQGREGERVVAYEAYLVDGVEVDRKVLAETAVSEPVDEVVRVGTRTAPRVPASSPVDPGTARAIGRDMVLARGWGEDQWACLDALWTKESNWRVDAANPTSSAYGIPQALPGSKMASAGDDWRTNAATQITWGLGYIAGRYGTPCAAWAHSQARNWY
ncbi:MAG: G5 domain-containing protein [Actinotalea sp.]|nr:G5 domain-containing protein [Actinotalea sp.]